MDDQQQGEYYHIVGHGNTKESKTEINYHNNDKSCDTPRFQVDIPSAVFHRET